MHLSAGAVHLSLHDRVVRKEQGEVKFIHSVGETFSSVSGFRQAVLQTLSSSKKQSLGHHWGLDSTWESLTAPTAITGEPLRGASRHLWSLPRWGLVSYLIGTCL